jgi:hypothetical protein
MTMKQIFCLILIATNVYSLNEDDTVLNASVKEKQDLVENK